MSLTKKSLLAGLTASIFSINIAWADLNSDAEIIFDWAEDLYPELFPTAQDTQFIDEWRYRYYPSMDVYTGVNDSGEVAVLGDIFGGLVVVGTVEEYIALASSSSTNLLLDGWIVNTTEQSAVLVESGSGILVNVQSASEETVNNESYVRVQATGIPNYQVTMTQAIIDSLNERPKASSDFASGSTTASVGQVVQFGEDIGYNNNNSQNCTTNAGYGYWPPGPKCPTNQSKDGYFTQSPQVSSSDCETGLGAIGYAVNGVSIYNWGDGASYNDEGVWQTLAPFAEVYDVDMCGGHAAEGDYHHHFYASCWGEVAGEDSQGHSELLGFAADGYPVYGPWHDTNVIAQSCWKKRDYSTNSETGCGSNGVRSCQLVDVYDISKGTTSTASGPTTSGSHTSLSGNTFTTTSGFYYEDYYFDNTCPETGEAYLDEFNGHDHDNLGYHYHTTVASNSDMTPAFPFILGPKFKGELPSNAIASCAAGTGGGSGGGGSEGPGGDSPPPRR